MDRLVREIHELIALRDEGKIDPEQFLTLQYELVREIDEIYERLDHEGRPKPRIVLGRRGRSK